MWTGLNLGLSSTNLDRFTAFCDHIRRVTGEMCEEYRQHLGVDVPPPVVF